VSEWRAVRLKHVASLRVSNVDKKCADDQLPVKLCNYTDVYYNENIDSTIPFMSATASAEQIREFQLQSGDVLITKDSETPDDIAVPAHVVDAADGVVCGYHLAVLRPRRRQVHGRYLFWSLKSTPLREQFAAGATGVTRFGLRTDVIGDACLLLPEPSRQRVIADFLDAETARIDALTDKKQRLAEVLKRRVSSSVEVAVQSSRSRWPCIPVKYLLHEIDERLGLRNPMELLSVSIHLGVVPRASVTDDQPRAEELSSYKVCKKNDMVINRMRAFHGGLGRAPVGGIVSPDYTVLRPTMGVDSRFLNHVFRSPWFIGELTALLRGIGSAHQGNVRTPRINFGDLGSILIPTPPLSVQQHLAETLDWEIRHTNSAVRALICQIALLHERRQALITAGVTGQLDIPGLAA
jgi:type I restriction enzyme S subunit